MTREEKRNNFRELSKEILRCKTYADCDKANVKLNIYDREGKLYKRDVEILAKDLGWVYQGLRIH